jgi:hypothetical protein
VDNFLTQNVDESLSSNIRKDNLSTELLVDRYVDCLLMIEKIFSLGLQKQLFCFPQLYLDTVPSLDQILKVLPQNDPQPIMCFPQYDLRSTVHKNHYILCAFLLKFPAHIEHCCI